METAWRAIDGGLDDLAFVDLAVLAADEVGCGVLQFQRVLDRVRVLQAVWMVEAGQRGVHAVAGHRDMSSWLAAKGKTSKASARRQADLAAALEKSPELAEAVGNGSISPDSATALLPALNAPTSGNTADLVEQAKGASPHEAQAAGSRFRELHPPEGSTPQSESDRIRAKRYFRLSDNGDGTTRIDGLLPTLDARAVSEALSSIGQQPTPGDDRTKEQRDADALVQLCIAHSNGEVKGGREAPTILVTIDLNDLNGNTRGPGYTSKGDVIPADAVRTMCANAFVRRVILDGSVPLDLGRTSRLASDNQFHALAVRDGGCRFAGCEMPANWCQVDHIQEWEADFGPTDLHLLVLWCKYHHGFRHRADVHLIGDADNLSVQLPDGSIVPVPPRGPTIKRAPATGRTPDPDPGQSDLFADPAA